jgi:hypothetical protein
LFEEAATPIGTNKIQPGLRKSGFVTPRFKLNISLEPDLNKVAMLLRVSPDWTV